MGAEQSQLSCTSRGKPISFESIEEGVDQAIDGVANEIEDAAEVLEQVIDDALRAPPATAHCKLSTSEGSVADSLFWHLVRAQGGTVAGGTAVLYEGLAMAIVLQRLRLLELGEGEVGASHTTASSAPPPRTLEGDDLVAAMMRRLHRFPVGHWLKADPTRRGYTLEEWMQLLRHLQMPLMLMETSTIPTDNPLPISTLLQVPGRSLLICGCANDSSLDKACHPTASLPTPAQQPLAAASPPTQAPPRGAQPGAFSPLPSTLSLAPLLSLLPAPVSLSPHVMLSEGAHVPHALPVCPRVRLPSCVGGALHRWAHLHRRRVLLHGRHRRLQLLGRHHRRTHLRGSPVCSPLRRPSAAPPPTPDILTTLVHCHGTVGRPSLARASQLRATNCAARPSQRLPPGGRRLLAPLHVPLRLCVLLCSSAHPLSSPTALPATHSVPPPLGPQRGIGLHSAARRAPRIPLARGHLQ